MHLHFKYSRFRRSRGDVRFNILRTGEYDRAKMDYWRTVFTERPYAAALDEEFVTIRCSNCFAPAYTRCTKCQTMVYCDDSCSKLDSPLHEIECSALPKMPSADVRLIARLANRTRIDGGIVSLSTDFPANVKERTANDLMSHYRDMKNDKRRRSRMEQIWSLWQEHMSNTVLGNLKKSEVQRFYCILCINTFGIFENGTIDRRTTSAVIGVGLYLNTSRFNHSCVPDLFVMSEGNQLSVIKPDTAETFDKSALVTTEKEFNRLTINYGVPVSDGGPYVPLTSQRVESLQSRYYFKCRCVKCSNKTLVAMEENASVYQCRKCGTPYVWRGRTAKLEQLCLCKEKQKLNVTYDDRMTAKMVVSLWESVMSGIDYATADAIIAQCEPLWRLAETVWHPTINLRFGQLNEVLFRAYCGKAFEKDDENALEETDRVNLLHNALVTGEMMVECYRYRLHNDPQLAIFYCQLAAVYKMAPAPGDDHPQKAYDCYTVALNIFKYNEDEEKQQLVLQYRAQISGEGCETTERTTTVRSMMSKDETTKSGMTEKLMSLSMPDKDTTTTRSNTFAGEMEKSEKQKKLEKMT